MSRHLGTAVWGAACGPDDAEEHQRLDDGADVFNLSSIDSRFNSSSLNDEPANTKLIHNAHTNVDLACGAYSRQRVQLVPLKQ
jgi:hypothetical protein